MYNSSLKTKTPLKAKTPLRAKTSLKARTPLQSKTKLTATRSLKAKQKTAKKLKQPYFSIFGPMNVCQITGAKENVVPHHIFNGANKTLSEKYGFMLPLRSDWHTGTNYAIHSDKSLDLFYRLICEKYYIDTLGGTKEQWISEFGKWWE